MSIRLGCFSPITMQGGGYFQFQCPNCSELRAPVNPSNNLAHCFCCGKNFNNIDLVLLHCHDFLPAVDILATWLRRVPAQPVVCEERVESSAR